MKKFWLIFAGEQMKATGKTLANLDEDRSGADDVIGGVMDAGGRALVALALGNTDGFSGYLRQIRDGIDSYLGADEAPGV